MEHAVALMFPVAVRVPLGVAPAHRAEVRVRLGVVPAHRGVERAPPVVEQVREALQPQASEVGKLLPGQVAVP